MTFDLDVDLFDPESVAAAVRKVNRIKKWIEKKGAELARRLAEVGMNEARIYFDVGSTFYDGDGSVAVTVEPSKDGYRIVAEGQAVCFIEFGAGVHFNGTEAYPNDDITRRQGGVVGIGQYGQGKGMRPNGWWYNDSDGKSHHTFGNPPAKAMWHGGVKVRNDLTRIAKEVFRS